MRTFKAIFPLAAFLLLAGCGTAQTEEPATREIFAMDTVMQVSAWGENGEAAVEETERDIRELENLLSRTRDSSQVTALNQADGAAVELEPELTRLIETAGVYTKATGGAFDITIAPVAEAWGFTTDSYQVPEPEQLEELLACVGMEHVHLDGQTGTTDPGTEIDLGGIAKGYASDRVAEIYADHGVERGMVYLGGNVLAWGDRPDGTPWRVGIQDPERPTEAEALVGIVHLEDAFAITSGGYQRYFEEGGRRYHHIIDPATGYPADSGLTSVTVVADAKEGRGTMCDALSTALFVLGEEGALDYWRNHSDELELVLVTEDGRVVTTAGLHDRFTPMEESGYTYETIS